MREQRLAVVGIKALQRLPEILGLFRQGFFPGAMPCRDRRRSRKSARPGNGDVSMSLASTCRQVSVV